MKQISSLWHSFRKNGDREKNVRDRLLLIVLAGLLLLVIVWPVSDSGSEKKISEGSTASSDQTNMPEDYASLMEQRLKDILENVDGAGKVQVMITVKGTSEQVVEKDESYSESRSTQSENEENSTISDSISRSESTVYNNSSSAGSPYVVKEMLPEVEGILVVAEGAGDETVVNEITYAVQVLFDVPVHKIKVAKMSSR
ncbi:MAG: stage III sporulation protein AG [Coprococcus sp.]